MSRTRTLAGAGVIATLILVLAFGNQAITEWVDRHHPTATDLWSFLLRELTWPRWSFSGGSAQNLLAMDLRALFLILFVGINLALVGKGVSGGGAFFLGWASLVFAAGLAAMITQFIVANPSLLSAVQSAGAGSAY